MGIRCGAQVCSADQYSVRHADELGTYPELDYHLLKGDRKGQHVVKLSKGMRLIFTLRDENTALIEEVSKHYEN
ncbi:hypothetical protein HZA56_02215 [Candidatus Poribacteria bacterium]|nr:hypothetical protein [Candidatus Poribacteria bacterium]